ncbi:hypothetical protein [Guptibacillus hwajinpoensis]|uniref:Uncharacterized protein n=1 Tax=Guptibacillus hwajinpoensis TaxID=208199 RepID=A0ABU0JVG8_9BACL|nr:hypothetical protein [Alkalihalobacillus hemicentroti]MDQ0481064.1 hypothetical protein [Alkalihalobacillus hemicentroti]
MDRKMTLDIIKSKGEVEKPEQPTKDEAIKLIEKASNGELSEYVFKQYFNYCGNAFTRALDSIEYLSSKNVSKDYMTMISDRMDKLNEQYLSAKDKESREANTKEFSELLNKAKLESDDQRNWITKLSYYSLTGIIIIAGVGIGMANKEVGKKVLEEGLNVFKDQRK